MSHYTPFNYNYTHKYSIGPSTMEIPNYLDIVIVSKDDKIEFKVIIALQDLYILQLKSSN
jgi:hypothetical protein